MGKKSSDPATGITSRQKEDYLRELAAQMHMEKFQHETAIEQAEALTDEQLPGRADVIEGHRKSIQVLEVRLGVVLGKLSAP
jgi:hypothetical protein